MSPIDWDQSFSVGHDMIDDQHREFLTIMNTIEFFSLNESAACNRCHYLSTLKRLLEYTEKHFKFEEALMQEYGYTCAYSHWRSHKDFETSIYTFYRRVVAGESDVDLSVYLILRDKLRKHILKDDKLTFRSIFLYEHIRESGSRLPYNALMRSNLNSPPSSKHYPLHLTASSIGDAIEP